MSHYADYKDFIVTNTISEEEYYEYYLGENSVSEDEWHHIIQLEWHRKHRFYVYVYLDPRKPGVWKAGGKTFLFEPFYIGKGTRKRSNAHLYEVLIGYTEGKNIHRYNKIRKIINSNESPIIHVIFADLTEDQAFQHESLLIESLGRTDLGTGPLTNKTNGGEGMSGYKWSLESRQRKSRKLLSRTPEQLAEQERKRLHTLKSHSPEQKEHFYKKRQLRKASRTNEHRARVSAAVSEATKLANSRRTEDQIRTRNEKFSRTMKNKSLEEKADITERRLSKMSNKTPEERSIIAQKKRDTRIRNKLKE